MAVKTLRAQFRITGMVRYLSHRQTMKMFERAFARADINICFSQGFNPHPRMSLPLPRPLGVESSEEVLVAKIDYQQSISEQGYKQRLGAQMPKGCEIKEMEFFETTISPVARALVYHFPIKDDFIESAGVSVKETNEKLKNKTPIIIERPGKSGKVKQMDAASFVDIIELDRNELKVKIFVRQDGSLRVNEIFELLNLNQSMLAGPVSRSGVEWKE